MQLICGDCLEVLKTIPDASVDAVVTDPPYGVLKHKIETGIDIPALFTECQRVLKPNSFLVYFGQQPTLTQWNTEAFKLFTYKSEIIWYKRTLSSMMNDIGRVYENIMVCTKGSRKFKQVRRPYTDVKTSLAEFTEINTILGAIENLKKPYKDKLLYEQALSYLEGKRFYTQKHTSNLQNVTFNCVRREPAWLQSIKYITEGLLPKNLVSFIPHNKQRYNRTGDGEYNIKFPTVKPIQLMEYLIDLTTSAGDLILDPFMGSGTTGIAAKSLNRDFIGIELMPEYFEIAKQRINDWQPPPQQELFDET